MESNERQAKAFKYYCMGLSAREIGKLMDLSPRTVQGYMNKGKWRERNRRNALKERVLEMFDSGMSYQEIADALGKSKSTIYNWLKDVRERKAKRKAQNRSIFPRFPL